MIYTFLKFILASFCGQEWQLEQDKELGTVVTCYGLTVFTIRHVGFLRPYPISAIRNKLDEGSINTRLGFSFPLLGNLIIGYNSSDTVRGITGINIGLVTGYVAMRALFGNKYKVTGTIMYEWDLIKFLRVKPSDMVDFERIVPKGTYGNKNPIVVDGFYYKRRFTPFVVIKAIIATVDGDEIVEHKVYKQVVLRPLKANKTKELVKKVVNSAVVNVEAAQ